jgi:hypothetical protein
MDQVEAIFDGAKRWLVMRRDAITTVCNLSSTPQSVPLDGVGCKNSSERVNQRMILASAAGCIVRDKEVELPPDAVAILAPATFVWR